MRIYKHTGDGHWIGSHIIVVAGDMRQARKMVREELDKAGLPNEQLDIEGIPIKAKTVVLALDGDY